MTIARVFLAGWVASALALAFDGDSFTAKFEALPQAVRETAKAHMENAFPVSIGTAKGEQGWDYQVNTRVDGKYHDLVINDKGKLVAVKDETDLGSIPAAAKAAIEKQAAASKIVTPGKGDGRRADQLPGRREGRCPGDQRSGPRRCRRNTEIEELGDYFNCAEEVIRSAFR